MKKLLLISSVLAVLTACGANVENNVADNGADAAAYLGDCQGATGVTPALNALDRDEWGTAGLDLEAMDKRFAAGDDFFCHVNGLWYSNFDMPEDKTRFGAFTLLRDKSEARVKVIIDELAAAQPDIATIEGKVAAYYNAYLNTDAIETAGMMPVQPYLDQINAMTTVEDLAMVFAGNGFSSPVGGWVDVDSLDTENYIFYLTQGGLGLPDRDMYLNDEGKNIETREGYLSYLTLLLGEAGYADSAEAAG